MSDARKTFDQVTEAVNRHDLDAAGRCYSPEVVLVSPDGKFEGRDRALRELGAFIEAFPDMRVTTWGKVTSGDVVVDEWTMTGTHTAPLRSADGQVIPATGRSVNLRGIDVGVVEHGLITSHRLYWDGLEFLTQLGLLNDSETVG